MMPPATGSQAAAAAAAAATRDVQRAFAHGCSPPGPPDGHLLVIEALSRSAGTLVTVLAAFGEVLPSLPAGQDSTGTLRALTAAAPNLTGASLFAGYALRQARHACRDAPGAEARSCAAVTTAAAAADALCDLACELGREVPGARRGQVAATTAAGQHIYDMAGDLATIFLLEAAAAARSWQAAGISGEAAATAVAALQHAARAIHQGLAVAAASIPSETWLSAAAAQLWPQAEYTHITAGHDEGSRP